MTALATIAPSPAYSTLAGLALASERRLSALIALPLHQRRRGGGANMPDEQPDLISAMPIPAAGGEPLRGYVERVLPPVYRASVREMASVAEVSSAPLWVFLPHVFTGAAVERLYAAMAHVDRQNSAATYARDLYHLWHSGTGERLPLTSRMAAAAIPDVEEQLQSVRICLPAKQAQLGKLFDAAKLRDMALAAMCGALRAGAFEARGFLADDRTRTEEAIAPAWWGDRHVVCAWRDGELRPGERAPAGTAYYRGLTISVLRSEADQGLVGTALRDGPSGGEQMLAELRRLIASGVAFGGAQGVQDAHNAVLRSLSAGGIDVSRRGYSYKTFSRVAGQILSAR